MYTLKLQMESANLSSTTDESRVQLVSLEYDEFRLARRLVSVGKEGTLLGESSGCPRRGPRATRCRYIAERPQPPPFQ